MTSNWYIRESFHILCSITSWFQCGHILVYMIVLLKNKINWSLIVIMFNMFIRYAFMTTLSLILIVVLQCWPKRMMMIYAIIIVLPIPIGLLGTFFDCWGIGISFTIISESFTKNVNNVRMDKMYCSFWKEYYEE